LVVSRHNPRILLRLSPSALGGGHGRRCGSAKEDACTAVIGANWPANLRG
jgi:hypothetical protein